MLAENLQHWAEQERTRGYNEARMQIARNLIQESQLTDQQIAEVTEFSLKEITALRKEMTHK